MHRTARTPPAGDYRPSDASRFTMGAGEASPGIIEPDRRSRAVMQLEPNGDGAWSELDRDGRLLRRQGGAFIGIGPPGFASAARFGDGSFLLRQASWNAPVYVGAWMIDTVPAMAAGELQGRPSPWPGDASPGS